MVTAQGSTPSLYETVGLLVCGAGAGAMTKTATAPLERIKIVLQLHTMTPGEAEHPKYRGIVQTGLRLAREEGVASLWRGNGANVARIIPIYAMRLGLNDTIKELVVGRQRVQSGQLTFAELVACGTVTGLIQQVITYPLETVRTRLSLGPSLGMQYRGIVDCTRRMIAEEGFGSLYKGLAPTIITGSPFVGLQLSIYAVMKQWGAAHDPFRTGSNPSPAYKMFAGASASLIAQTLMYGGDTVRRRMQTNGAGGQARLYSTSWDCAVKLWKSEGIYGFYRGNMANTVRAIPGGALQFYFYELLVNAAGLSHASGGGGGGG
jgi:solute carrier family 25 (mitochondrial phosphate transporter), member 23/24/25/41